MSFFQDIPPPLDDDKIQEVDEFDLDDESSNRISRELPEISNNNFDVYNSSSLKPPEISAALFFDEPPPDDDYDPIKVSREDSFEDFVYHQDSLSQMNESVTIVDQNNMIIEDCMSGKQLDVIDDSMVEPKLSQFQEISKDQEISPIEVCSRTLNVSMEHEQGEPKELILSPDVPNFIESFAEEDLPPLDLQCSPPPLKEPNDSMESDNLAISSFTSSLKCIDDNIEGNLHSEDVHYAKEIIFNETMQAGEDEINQDDNSDNFNSKFNEEVTESTQDIPLDNDDDDDDFNDFETAIPVHRTIETQPSVMFDTHITEDVRFEADFSAFNDPPVEFNENNDDDFGDFNDFETAPMASQSLAQETHSIEFVKPSNVNGLIDEMFPKLDGQQSDDGGTLEMKYESYANNIMKSDDIVKKLDDFDATFALGYLYNSSTASQILVKALGIDTRNILLGPQWGNSSSSSSNMPRFASNLSFNPLEPLKPSSSKSDTSDMKILAPTRPDVVPEVQFDWNSSGLVNPLDGKQFNAQQQSNIEVQQSTTVFKSTSPITVTPLPTHPFESEPSSHEMDEKEMTQPEVESSVGPSGTDLDINLSKFSSWDPSFQPPASSVLVRERTIKLPETHIFTPVKSTSPIAREVISRDVSPSTIVVKEYHDVEYLEPKRKPEPESDFEDFQSASIEPNITNFNEPTPVLMPSLNILAPQKIVENQKSNNITWPNPGETLEDFTFMEIPKGIENFIIPPVEPAFNDLKINSTKSTNIRELPVIGNSPSKHLPAEDDDFTEFQAAPVISIPNQSTIKESAYQNSGNILSIQKSNNLISVMKQTTDSKPISNEPLTLSPSKLVSTMNNHGMSQKPSWITSMDDDEVCRIEAAFPKCKVSPKPQPKSNEADDDDWSDFVGVPTAAQFHQSQSHNVLNNHHQQQKSDDWCDFVSAPAPMATVNSISSQILSKPNFASWNQPVGKPYVHHATSFLSSEPKQFNSAGYQYGANNNQRAGMNITNNFNYQQNGISTILPELDFAMPRNLINLPRSGSSTESSGKK